jgi:hypothetical protein
MCTYVCKGTYSNSKDSGERNGDSIMPLKMIYYVLLVDEDDDVEEDEEECFNL